MSSSAAPPVPPPVPRPVPRPAAPPPAAGVRMPWAGLPPTVRTALEDRLGSPVAEAMTQSGGFSPGVAARLRLVDGRRIFVKAVGPELNPDTPGMHRQEARIAAALPPSAPCPRLRWMYDDGEWVALAFDDVDGSPPAQPWRPAELARVLAAVDELAVALTPAPIAAPVVAVAFDRQFRGWRRLATAVPPDLVPWARRHLDHLVGLEQRWAESAAGSALLHGDLRADNLLLTADRVWVVDWPWACVGAPWFDLVCMLPSVAMQGGPDPEDALERSAVARAADPADVTAVLAALAGYFVRQAGRPAPPGLPTLRDFQAAQGRVALTWLARRTGLR